MEKLIITEVFQMHYPSKKVGAWNQIQTGVKRNFTAGEEYNVIQDPDPDNTNAPGIMHVATFIPLSCIPAENYSIS